MSSYFDHFILTQILSNYITDSFIILILTISLYLIIKNNIYIIPFRYQYIFEIVLNHWKTVILENLNKNNIYYFLPLCTLFLFLFGVNLLGFFTYTFPTTTHIFITFGLAFSIWLGVIIFGFYNYKLSFFSIFLPNGSPLGLAPLLITIEIASNISRPIALGMRLAANLTAGHILMAILSDFSSKLLYFTYGLSIIFPFLIIIFMTILEIGVLVIQAYVFCLLSMIYIKDSIELH
uniref:ATP synthase subunit a n=1 Tax=Pennaria disticha TaxID=264068 RepID=G9ISZ1_9CNID|nr:ATP synthase F0 subunit 6 [Pennaria disticha]